MIMRLDLTFSHNPVMPHGEVDDGNYEWFDLDDSPREDPFVTAEPESFSFWASPF